MNPIVKICDLTDEPGRFNCCPELVAKHNPGQVAPKTAQKPASKPSKRLSITKQSLDGAEEVEELARLPLEPVLQIGQILAGSGKRGTLVRLASACREYLLLLQPLWLADVHLVNDFIFWHPGHSLSREELLARFARDALKTEKFRHIKYLGGVGLETSKGALTILRAIARQEEARFESLEEGHLESLAASFEFDVNLTRRGQKKYQKYVAQVWEVIGRFLKVGRELGSTLRRQLGWRRGLRRRRWTIFGRK